MTEEARMVTRGHGRAPQGAGWFVLGAAEAAWSAGAFGTWTSFEGEQRLSSLGVNLARLEPGQPLSYYHAEQDTEAFVVLEGECLLLVEEQERPLRRWDYFHCAPGTAHTIVGAGEAPCLLLAIGTRIPPEDIRYPVSALARAHRAGTSTETTDPDEAYAGVPADEPVAFDPRWLR